MDDRMKKRVQRDFKLLGDGIIDRAAQDIMFIASANHIEDEDEVLNMFNILVKAKIMNLNESGLREELDKKTEYVEGKFDEIMKMIHGEFDKDKL